MIGSECLWIRKKYGKGGRMAETYQIEMNLEQLERLLKNLPEGIMLEICFGKEEHGEDT